MRIIPKTNMKIASGIIFVVILEVVSGIFNKQENQLDILNRCLETVTHKVRPTSEDELLSDYVRK